MWRFLVRWLAPLFVAGSCCLPNAYAQRPNPSPESESSRTPALPYTVAFASTLLVMVILCTPSRKR